LSRPTAELPRPLRALESQQLSLANPVAEARALLDHVADVRGVPELEVQRLRSLVVADHVERLEGAGRHRHGLLAIDTALQEYLRGLPSDGRFAREFRVPPLPYLEGKGQAE